MFILGTISYIYSSCGEGENILTDGDKGIKKSEKHYYYKFNNQGGVFYHDNLTLVLFWQQICWRKNRNLTNSKILWKLNTFTIRSSIFQGISHV